MKQNQACSVSRTAASQWNRPASSPSCCDPSVLVSRLEAGQAGRGACRTPLNGRPVPVVLALRTSGSGSPGAAGGRSCRTSARSSDRQAVRRMPPSGDGVSARMVSRAARRTGLAPCLAVAAGPGRTAGHSLSSSWQLGQSPSPSVSRSSTVHRLPVGLFGDGGDLRPYPRSLRHRRRRPEQGGTWPSRFVLVVPVEDGDRHEDEGGAGVPNHCGERASAITAPASSSAGRSATPQRSDIRTGCATRAAAPGGVGPNVLAGDWCQSRQTAVPASGPHADLAPLEVPAAVACRCSEPMGPWHVPRPGGRWPCGRTPWANHLGRAMHLGRAATLAEPQSGPVHLGRAHDGPADDLGRAGHLGQVPGPGRTPWPSRTPGPSRHWAIRTPGPTRTWAEPDTWATGANADAFMGAPFPDGGHGSGSMATGAAGPGEVGDDHHPPRPDSRTQHVGGGEHPSSMWTMAGRTVRTTDWNRGDRRIPVRTATAVAAATSRSRPPGRRWSWGRDGGTSGSTAVQRSAAGEVRQERHRGTPRRDR